MRRLRMPYRLAIALATLVAVACACAQDEDQRKAQEIWKGHDAIVAQAVRGEEHDADQFIESVNFFRKVAGLRIRVEIYTYGYIPIAETEGDFEKVRAWYEENGDRLDYDPATGRVFLRERPDGDG